MKKNNADDQLSHQQWEAICKQCGLCCFEKFRDNRNRVITTAIPCRYLDIFTRECKVYDRRFEMGEDCQKLTPELVASVDWLPEQCAYRQRAEQQQQNAPSPKRKRRK